MITYDEIKKAHASLFDSYISGNFAPFPTRSDLDTIKQYINEHEKKDELLGLYRENFNFLYNQVHMGMLLDHDKYMSNFELIKALEEEIKW